MLCTVQHPDPQKPSLHTSNNYSANGGRRNRTCRSCKTSLSKVEEENKIMKNPSKQSSQQPSPQHSLQAALLTQLPPQQLLRQRQPQQQKLPQRQQRLNPQTQQIQLLQTVPTPSASTSSQSTALSTTAAKASLRGLQRTVSLKERTLPY